MPTAAAAWSANATILTAIVVYLPNAESMQIAQTSSGAQEPLAATFVIQNPTHALPRHNAKAPTALPQNAIASQAKADLPADSTHQYRRFAVK
jgi:hypothetical protein